MITYIDLIKRLKGTKITRIFISTIAAWCPISHGISSKESFCLLRLCSFDRASLCLLCFLLRVKSLYKKNKEFKTALITSFILLLSVTEIIYAFCVNEPFHYICSKNICHNIFSQILQECYVLHCLQHVLCKTETLLKKKVSFDTLFSTCTYSFSVVFSIQGIFQTRQAQNFHIRFILSLTHHDKSQLG